MFARFSLVVVSLLCLCLSQPFCVDGHLQMSAPAPRRSKFSTAYQQLGQVDYDMSTPLGTFPCKGYPKGPVTATVQAGSSLSVAIDGSANHGGGHCQFALSYDNGATFVVIHTIGNGDCVKSAPFTYSIPIPSAIPSSSSVVFAWTWINAVGNREYYMNCADIAITGGSGNSLTGKELLVVNLPGRAVVAEFAGNSQTGMDLLNARRTITINAAGTVTDTQPGTATSPPNVVTVAPTTQPLPPINSGKCAMGSQCSSTIPCCDGSCCSKWGYCGLSDAHCGLGCVSKCDNTQINQRPVTIAPVTIAPQTCASGNTEQTLCSASLPCCDGTCCSKYGYCGKTQEHCGTGCQSKCTGIAVLPQPPPQPTTPPQGQCGISTCSATSPCCSGACCSKWGYCGKTAEYCSAASGCQSNCEGQTVTTAQPPANIPSAPTAKVPMTSGNLFDYSYFACMFRPANDEARATLLHRGFVNGANKFGYRPANAVELAAFYGHVAHESDYLKTLSEYCSRTDTCSDYQDFWCPARTIPTGKKYYGRGWLQLTWPCNYIAAGADSRIATDIFANPDLVETDYDLAVQTALWFWDVNGISVYARGGQFSATTDKINGALECRGGAGSANQLQRIERYQQARVCLGLPRETDQNKLSCAAPTFKTLAVPLTVLNANATQQEAEWNYDVDAENSIVDDGTGSSGTTNTPTSPNTPTSTNAPTSPNTPTSTNAPTSPNTPTSTSPSSTGNNPTNQATTTIATTTSSIICLIIASIFVALL